MPGRLEHSPGDILRKMLIDLSLGTQPSAASPWPVYVSQRPDRPDQLIVVTDTMGLSDGRTQVDGEIQGREGCQILVRSLNFPIGHNRADLIAKTLDTEVYDETITIGTSTYTVHSVSRSGGPGTLYLGKEKEASRRDLFSINVTLSVRQDPS